MRNALLVTLLLTGCGGAAAAPPTAPSLRKEAASAASPDGPEVTARAASLRSDARGAYREKKYGACVQLFGEAERLGPAGQGDAYDAACCQALASDAAGAFTSLGRAIDRGYRDAGHLERDEDLVGLHGDARWAPLLERAKSAREAYMRTLNQELFTMYEEDQHDRMGDAATLDGSLITKRDAERRAQTQKILDAGGAKVADDYFHAAMIFQHGMAVADFQRSRELALKALELDPNHKSARWLAAASKDRELMYSGKPQLYGTQMLLERGRWVVYETDPSVTDEERKKWNVPPLSGARKRAEAMNAKRPH